jgi:hypothetical protein
VTRDMMMMMMMIIIIIIIITFDVRPAVTVV